jgi:RNA-directed DNA polymerase
MLANVVLHYVLDAWFEREVRPRMKGRCFLLRVADDFVIGCEREEVVYLQPADNSQA